ncbi:MAG TPA: PhnD/SsuA/transferrin family substrate-binding protein, partial [Polyangiaceae bacterium]|nr:PhnD/SsuA/transferrin family substrate-binding protein [Polyangiaceae bacterium]
EVSAPQAGGRRYFLVSKQASALDACVGHRLATTFATDVKFIDRVVADGAFKLADFTLVAAQRPLEPLKQVLRDQADCALIDDAQLSASAHIEHGAELRSVWQSVELPGMTVVAFPRTDAGAAKSLKQSLAGLCAKAKQACASVGIDLIRPSTDERYRTLVARYSKP